MVSYLLIIITILCSIITVFGNEHEGVVVNVGNLGKIRGTLTFTLEEHGVRREYLQFTGIPYAKAQRFSPSTLFEADLGGGKIFNATSVPSAVPKCFQPFLPYPFLTEDCLMINVYTRLKNTMMNSSLSLLPVLFFIHGGDFEVGNGAMYSGARFLNRDIVLVTFNYRLGILGFFTLQNEDIPGNAGMYDIINALNWTNRFISHFGGDPTKITIAGNGAGSVAVTQLMASPMGQDLFQAAIASSGSTLSTSSLNVDPMADSLAIANLTGCHKLEEETNHQAIAACMRNVKNASLFVEVLSQYKVLEALKGKLGFISPVVQDFEMEGKTFLPEHPLNVFTRGEESKIPLMMGCTKHEGSLKLGRFCNTFLKGNGIAANETFVRKQLVPAALSCLGIEDSPMGMYDSIKLLYLGEDRNSGDFEQVYPGLLDIFSVFGTKGSAYQTALLHYDDADTFWYSFDFRGNATLFDTSFPGGEVPPFFGGVTNSDDLIYLFDLTPAPLIPEEAKMSTRLLNYWVDFVTNFSPSPNWTPLDGDGLSYMAINSKDWIRQDYPKSWVGPGLTIQLVKSLDEEYRNQLHATFV